MCINLDAGSSVPIQQRGVLCSALLARTVTLRGDGQSKRRRRPNQGRSCSLHCSRGGGGDPKQRHRRPPPRRSHHRTNSNASGSPREPLLLQWARGGREREREREREELTSSHHHARKGIAEVEESRGDDSVSPCSLPPLDRSSSPPSPPPAAASEGCGHGRGAEERRPEPPVLRAGEVNAAFGGGGR